MVAGIALLPAAGAASPADWADPAVLVPIFWGAGAVDFAYRPRQRCGRLLFTAGTLLAVAHALATWSGTRRSTAPSSP